MLSPLACLVVGVALILVLMLVFRFNAFLALISSAFVIAFFSDRIPLEKVIPIVTKGVGETSGFGDMMGKLGILLVLASIIGKCLMDSGAADRIVRSFTRLFGEGREHYSLFSSSFVLSIPVFFDVVFYLLAPLARAVYARRKRDYALILCAAAAGGAITHTVVPPTPGPLAVAEYLKVSLSLTIGMGIIAAIIPAILGGILYGRWINRRLVIHPKQVLGVSDQELEVTASKPDHELPSLFISFLPIVLPVILLTLTSIAAPLIKEGEAMRWILQLQTRGIRFFNFLIPSLENGSLLVWVNFIGDKNISFFGGAIISIWMLYHQQQKSLKKIFEDLEPALSSGAMMALIVCAGGSFGAVLKEAGVGDVISSGARNWGLSVLAMAFLASLLIRIAQGSATVAMITAVGIISPALAAVSLPFHPVYLVFVIGFGATSFSWMNDAGFWIVGQMGGLTETETFKTWTMITNIMAISGFCWVWLLTKIFPLI